MIKATKTILILLTALALALGCLDTAAEGPTPWAKLQDMINSAADDGIRTIILDVDLTAQAGEAALVIPARKKITLNLAGHTLSRGLEAATDGGHVITVNGSLTVIGSGAIKGGWTNGDGGGVFLKTDATFNLTGGEISGNSAGVHGGGVSVHPGSAFTLSGRVNISGNAVGIANSNVYLGARQDDQAILSIVGPLESDTLVGVDLETPGVFTSGLRGKGTLENFSSDCAAYVLSVNEGGDALLSQSSPDFVLPGSVKAVEANAFESAAVKSVYIPDGCASIGAEAFRNCRKLVWIRVPAKCLINPSAFEKCDLVYIFSAADSKAKTYCEMHPNCVFVEEKAAD